MIDPEMFEFKAIGGCDICGACANSIDNAGCMQTILIKLGACARANNNYFFQDFSQ